MIDSFIIYFHVPRQMGRMYLWAHLISTQQSYRRFKFFMQSKNPCNQPSLCWHYVLDVQSLTVSHILQDKINVVV